MTERAYHPDIRPHVPYVDPHADDRLHLILDGVSACGLQSPQRGTHCVDEQDCPACNEALRQAFMPSQQRPVVRNEVTRDDLARSMPGVPAGWDKIEGGDER